MPAEYAALALGAASLPIIGPSGSVLRCVQVNLVDHRFRPNLFCRGGRSVVLGRVHGESPVDLVLVCLLYVFLQLGRP